MSAKAALSALLARHGDDLPLDRSLLALAREEYPALDEDRYRRQLDRWAGLVELRIRAGLPAPFALNRVLFDEIGLRGNTDAYYDPANSLLNLVLDRRLGIPITLAAVYIEVARRVGQATEGISFPGHFLVRHHFQGRELLVDAFHGGEHLTRADCAARLEVMSEGKASLAGWMFAPASGRTLVARVLTNLKVAYAKAGDVVQAIRAIDRLIVVAPERDEERRDRGLLYAELGLANAAVTDLEAYLAAVPEADDRASIQARLPGLMLAASRMN